MSLLNISTNQITFQTNDSFKTVTLTNLGESQKTRRPLMYKIKTNKIDYVDAKPSCGYISALKGQNEISVLIRSLTSQKQYTAKLQILYVSHQKITEQLVQKSKRQFDMIEYNEIYDSIKNSSQANVKTAIINVTKKANTNSNLTTTDKSQSSNVSANDSLFSSVKMSQSSITGESKMKEKQLGRYESFPRDKKKASSSGGHSCGFSFCMLLIGLIVGLFMGVRYAERVSEVINSVPVLSQARDRLVSIGRSSSQNVNKVQEVLAQQHQNEGVVVGDEDLSQRAIQIDSDQQQQQGQSVQQQKDKNQPLTQQQQSNNEESNKVVVILKQTIAIEQTANQQQQQTKDDTL